MTAASTSDARKRNAEKASAIQSYALARSSRDCQRGQHDDCNGLAFDHDRHLVISCMCGCRIANGTTRPLDTPDASTGHTDGLEAHLEEGRGRE